MRFRLIVLALGTFAIGTGSFVFAGPLEGVARDLSVSVVTVFAVTYAISSPRARYACGERGAEADPRGGDGGVRAG